VPRIRLIIWNLVDIHSHVIYGVDDGARTFEDSLALVRMSAASGTTDLVATPHANPQYRYDRDLLTERLAQIGEASGVALRLHLGCDFYLSYDNIRDAIANPTKYTINQKNYLLVEFSDMLVFRNTGDIFARLQEAGMTPIVTHPERNALIRQRLEDLERWVEDGAYLQITAQSLLGTFGRQAKEFCTTLLERRLVHFVASDAHDIEHRPPKLDGAYALLKKQYGESFAETLCVTNPAAVLVGEGLESPYPDVATEPRKWYQIWR
jgi:protein-tyrosine phosphatase